MPPVRRLRGISQLAKGCQSGARGIAVRRLRDIPPRSWKEAIASRRLTRALRSEDFEQSLQPSMLGRPIRARTGAKQSQGSLHHYGPSLPQALSHFLHSLHYAALSEATDIRKASPLSCTAQGRGLIV